MKLNSVLRGHFGYDGIAGNIHSLRKVQRFAVSQWRRALNRRSQRAKMTWARVNRILEIYPLQQPHLRLSYTTMKSYVVL